MINNIHTSMTRVAGHGGYKGIEIYHIVIEIPTVEGIMEVIDNILHGRIRLSSGYNYAYVRRKVKAYETYVDWVFRCTQDGGYDLQAFCKSEIREVLEHYRVSPCPTATVTKEFVWLQ